MGIMEAYSALSTTLPAVLAALQQADAFWRGLPSLYVLIGHCLFCASLASEYKDRYALHYVLTHLWGFGGGITSALLVLDYNKAPLALFVDNSVALAWTASWWVVNYFPGGMPGRLHDLWYIKMFTKACTTLLKVKLIYARVDLAAIMFPGVVAPAIILGTLAGCGGRLLADAIKVSWGESQHTAELTSPGFVSRAAALNAVLYYLACHAWGELLPRTAMTGLLITLNMVHSFAADFAGAPLDATEPFAVLLCRISNVPMPKKSLLAASKAVISAAATRKQPAAELGKLQPAFAGTPVAVVATPGKEAAPTAAVPTRRSGRSTRNKKAQ